MAFANLQGQSIFYTRHWPATSERPALVLVHGAGGTHLHWPPSLRRLSNATVLALDLPGHWRSPGTGRQTTAEYAEAVLAAIDHSGIQKAVIGGHSMGGAIALNFALMHPERTAGLILIGTGARLKVAPAILDGLSADFTGTVDQIARWSYSAETPESLVQLGAQRMREIAPETHRGDFIACNEFDMTERLGEIASPAFVVCGAADRMTPERHSRHLVEHLPRAELLIVPGAGHMVMIEQSAAVTEALKKFTGEIE